MGLAGLLAVVSLTGCGVFRDGAVHPSVNDCVAAIPVAQTLARTDAHAAQLVRLRRLPLARVQVLLRRLEAAPLSRADAPRGATASPVPTSGPNGPQPCVLVFSGSFTAAGLAKAPGLAGATSGGYVVVVTTTRHPRVLRTVVTTSDPTI